MPHFLSLFTKGLGFTPAVERRMIRRSEEEHSIAWENCVVEWVAGGQAVPALLVHDAADPDVPWPHVERVRRAWTNHHAITTNGMGHRGSLHSDAIVDATSDFLAGRDVVLPTEVGKA